ncbi:MAG: hypothetical protein [Bacteriophage sp.]|nr:MAG: hypothetical protein [Bacteriophage sp.]
MTNKNYIEDNLKTAIALMPVEDLVNTLQKAGYDVVAIPEKEQRIRHLTIELKAFEDECDKLTNRANEIRNEIQSLCDHSFGEASYSDDHDGWSRCDYTQTKRERCTKCGLTNITKKVLSY